MSHPSSTLRSLDASQAEDLLFKPDRPRRIDQFIDFFGNDSRGAGDACAEARLDTSDDEDTD